MVNCFSNYIECEKVSGKEILFKYTRQLGEVPYILSVGYTYVTLYAIIDRNIYLKSNAKGM